MNTVSSSDTNVIQENMGMFGPDKQLLSFSKDDVFNALKGFVSAAGLDCTLITRAVCDAPVVTSPITPTTEGVPTPITTSNPTSYPTPKLPTPPPAVPTDEVIDLGEDETSADVRYCEHGIDGGVPSKEDAMGGVLVGDYMQLMGGAYSPTSNIDHL